MIGTAVWQTHDAASHDPQSPAEVDLLIMGEKAGIQSSHLPVILRPYHQGCPRCPEHIRSIIILTIVGFHGLKDTASAERITETVQESPTRPCVLKTVFIENGKQLRLTGRHVLMTVEELDHRRQPVVRHLDIRIQQQIILRVDLFEGLVIPLGKTPVLLQQNQLHLREMLTEQLQRIVGRSIVSHIHRRLLTGIQQHRWQILLQHPTAIPVQDHNSYFLHTRAYLI